MWKRNIEDGCCFSINNKQKIDFPWRQSCKLTRDPLIFVEALTSETENWFKLVDRGFEKRWDESDIRNLLADNWNPPAAYSDASEKNEVIYSVFSWVRI